MSSEPFVVVAVHVENGLHWIVDVQMGEDACAIRDRAGAKNSATLRRIALMLLQREDSLRRGVRARQKNAAWDHDYLLQVLARGTPEFPA